MSNNISAVEVKQFLTFAVAEEEYAIDILRVKEILAYAPLTRVPRAPRFISGVMNLRGTVVPVVDLRIKLAMPATVVTPLTCIIIIDVAGESGPTTMGVLTEDVKQVIDLTDDQIEPPPSFGTKIDLAFLAGMGDLGDRFTLILEIDKVLSALEIIAAAAAAETAAETAGAPPEAKPSGKRQRKRRRAQAQ